MVEAGVLVSVSEEVRANAEIRVVVGVGSGNMALLIVHNPQHKVTTPNNMRIGIAIFFLGFLKI